MPEIKHNFTSGKMNKDLDERLIPDGEYRDAMNVQVSTSEGSDVGTIQNILPNNYGCTDDAGVPITSMESLISSHATTVGSISDEKNDSLYWLVSGHSTSSLATDTPGGVLSAAGGNPGSWWFELNNEALGSGKYLLKDIIMEAKIGKTTAVVGDDAGNIIASKPTALCAPVFVDVWGFIINSSGGSTNGDEYFNVGDVELASLLETGWKVASIKPLGAGGIHDTATVESVVEFSKTHINVTPRMTTTTSWVQKGYYIRVALGVAQQTTVNPDWEYDGNIYLQVDVDPVGGDEIIGGANGMGLQYKPQVGDEIRNFGINTGINPRAGINFDDGTTLSNISTTATITSVGAYQTVSSSGATYDWWKITVQEDIVFASSFGQSFLNTWGNNMSNVYSACCLGGAGFLTDPGKYQMEVFESQLGATPDGSGIMEFNVTQNILLTNAGLGDPIGWSPTYPAYDDQNQLSQPMCIDLLVLAEPSEYVISFPFPYWTDPVPGQIRINDCNITNPTIIQPQPYGGNYAGSTIQMQGVEETIVKLDTAIDTTYFGQDLAVIFYNPNRVLNFNIDKLITGINIVDDLLFWTDGDSEPKKINIKRSRQGTDDTGLLHTRLVNTFTSPADGYVPVREEHVTVIKKAPNKTITVATEDFTSLENADILRVQSGSKGVSSNKFGNMAVGQTTRITLAINVQDIVKLNDVLRFSTYDDELLEGEYEIRAVVTDVRMATNNPSYSWTNFNYRVFRLEILNIKADANIGLGNPQWYAVIEATGKRLFERKLPRFSYRYKYLDNEYSTFAPFTNITFNPGQFRYHPTEAYNTAMVNNIKSITLKDFVGSDIPADVKQIDLLYKNDTDPSVYIIDTLTPKDDSTSDTTNPWYGSGTVDVINQMSENGKFATTGSYDIKTENIFATLPSNQLLRPWDNVPKTALAQEVTGNRVVYGNYTQGYNLTNVAGGDDVIVPEIDISLRTRSAAESTDFGKKSIKSLRNYEVGVVWGDKYGRETPVISPSSGSLNVPKSRAEQSNFIGLALKNSPDWADYYKFYIKETSNEYYNLAVDRVYEDGEDLNIWLSFPSIDRNKVDEDTYLILKKGQGEDAKLVLEDARYKIVAIENEAPEQIKSSFTKLMRTNTDGSRVASSCNMYGGSTSGGCNLNTVGGRNAPTPGVKSFSLKKNFWSDPYNATGVGGTVAMGLTSPVKIFEEVTSNSATSDELWVGFSKEVSGQPPVYSLKYLVIDAEEEGLSSTSKHYTIRLASPILSQDSFITDDLDNQDNIHVHFWKKVVENKPEFDGRFFVKILSDPILDDYLVSTIERTSSWAITTAVDVFKIASSNTSYISFPNIFYSYPGAGAGFGLVGSPDLDFVTEAQWKTLLEFGTGSIKSNWFIDGAPFAGHQPLSNNNYTNSEVEFPEMLAGGNDIPSCDITSSVSWEYEYYNATIGQWLPPPGGTNWSNSGTGQSTGFLRMRADSVLSTETTLDLSYSQVEPHGNWASGGKTKNYNLNWAVGDPSVSANDDQEVVVKNLAINKRFRFKGNDTIYKITGVTKHRLYNYMGRRVPHNPTLSGNVATGGAPYWSSLHKKETKTMSRSWNRRLTYRLKYELDEASPGNNFPLNQNTTFGTAGKTTSVEMQFMTEYQVDEKNKISTHPAIFETEPKEDLDLNLYYEASGNIPTLPINSKNRHMFIPIGATLELAFNDQDTDFPEGVFVAGWKNDSDGNHQVVLSNVISADDVAQLITNGAKFVRDDGGYTSANIVSGSNIGTGTSAYANVLNLFPTQEVGLGWYNCFSFNNGVESNRIGDTFNKPFTTNGVKASTVLEEYTGQEHRKYGLIYSGIYNSNSGVNNLNQFIAAEKITKDINPIYGSIQKLHSRNSDLVTLCEDKILKILANKDAVFNADGNPQLTATDRVLGQTIPFAGEYGISTNPESFASESYRAYFTDKVRGTVMRLSKDGLTAISDHGMKDWFRDNLKLYTKLIGSYDDRKDEYNITLTH